MAAHLVTCRWLWVVEEPTLTAHILSAICRRWNQDLAADIDLDREGFGLNYPRTCSGTPHIFYFLKARRADNGPRKAWAHMGWVGHPAH